MKYTFSILLYALTLIAAGCSKNKDGPNDGEPGGLKGALLYDAGEQSYQFDLNNQVSNVYFDRNNYSLNGWDVSWNGQLRLETSIITGTFDRVQFRLVNTKDGSISKEFVYENAYNEDRQINGLLSPDQSLVLIQPDFDHGIVLIDMDGKARYHLPVVKDTRLTLGDEAIWLPDNTLLFTFDKKYLLKSAPPYTTIEAVGELNYSDWGNIRSNQDGSKLSLRIDKHIYLMNGDGSGLVQVTESDREEREAVFSPDGKHLLVAANYYPRTFSSGVWDLNIIRPMETSIKSEQIPDPESKLFNRKKSLYLKPQVIGCSGVEIRSFQLKEDLNSRGVCCVLFLNNLLKDCG